MPSGSCLISKLYDKIIKMPSKSHETIPLSMQFCEIGKIQNRIFSDISGMFKRKYR
jgi:hypothetical protein